MHSRSLTLASIALAFVAATVTLAQRHADRCAPGFSASGELDFDAPRAAGACQPLRHPESAREILAANDTHYRKSGKVAAGAVRAALEQKAALQPLRAKIAGAAGQWRPYGLGDLRAPGSGTDHLAARVDNFAYDALHQRLFAASGSAGIWMTAAQDGDVRTLGNHWISVSDALPSEVASGIAWTSAGGTAQSGGTLIAVGGEAVMGSDGYLGLGAFWSDDLGASWHQATDVPDAALAFKVDVDEAHPNLVYAATSKGLFRSGDAGRSYVNVALPTTDDCAGVETLGPCQFTNYVTDVFVQRAGGSGNTACDDAGCPVIAAVGFRTGPLAFQDGRPMAPANGLYRSSTGAAGSFAKLDISAAVSEDPLAFAPQDRIGRIALGGAIGDAQDHNYLYAMVEDAVLFNGGYPFDAPIDLPMLPTPPTGPIIATVFNGLYVSKDFGDSWIRMADAAEVLQPASNSALVIQVALGYQPGVQAWYNLWAHPDPTRADSSGVPTRMSFGLEEVWQNAVPGLALDGVNQSGPADFRVIGQYSALTASTTTHPDQHAGIYVPTGDGGVCLFAGSDGGVFRQCVAAGEEMTNDKWGDGANTDMYALLPYGIGVAKDGTVWWGLQDNGSGHTEPDSRVSTMDFGADGFYAEVDPDNSDVAYTESQNGGLRRTTDRGQSSSSIAPSYTKPQFDNWFAMDPRDAQHMVTGAQEVYETASAETVTGSSWVQVFNLGTNPDTGATRTTTTMSVLGEAVYVGGCGDCGVSGNDTGFSNVLATNVGGDATPQRETASGWHFAAKAGLDNRYITSVAIAPDDPRTIYVTLAGYLSNLRPAGSYLDPNTNIGTGNVFKSTDAGEHFTEISANLPRAAANSVIVRNKQLLLGTDIGAFISKDLDGSQWAPLGDGLPGAPVNMLRLQPGNPDHLFAATFGRHIWTYDFAAASDGGGGESSHHGDSSRGLFLGALSPALLAGLALASWRRRRRRNA